MIQTLKTTLKLETSMNVNAFLFYFKRIPVIGKIFSDNIYQEISLKTAISILVFLLKLFTELFGKVLYIGLAIFLPIAFFYRDKSAIIQSTAFIHLLFVMGCLISGFLFNKTFEVSKPRMIAIQILHIPAPKYSIISTLYYTLRSTILYFPVIILFTMLAKGSVWQGFCMTILLCFSQFIGEAVQLFIFERTGKSLQKHKAIYIALWLILLTVCYLPLFIHYNTPTRMIICSLPFFLVSMVAATGSILYILKYKYYVRAFHETNKSDDINMDRKQVARESNFAAVKLNDSDLADSLQHQDTYKNKHGYAYLNALFFERHRRMLLKPMYISLACIGIVFLASLTASFLVPNFAPLYLAGIQKGFPSLVFIMYTLSLFLCERAVKAMFYNCDISLLRYSYYRKKSVILSNFRLRFFRILFISGIPALAIGTSLFILGLLTNPKDMKTFVSVVFLIFILSIFYTIHHLFMYYVFQPYTTDLQVKNPFFKLINGIVYLFSYICLQIHEAPNAFVIIILVVTIVYSIVAMILIVRLAPKTFRVK